MSEVVLVTGGAGYVGSHACKALAEAGYLPVTVDDLSSGHREAVRWGPLEVADVRDRVELERIFSTHRPVAVFHFAGLVRVDESLDDPARYYDANVGGTLALLEACKRAGTRYFVLSSSAAVYGVPEGGAIAEDHPTRPLSPYGESKLLSERLLADFEESAGIAHCSLRYFNAAGLDAEDDLSWSQGQRPHLIPTILSVARGDRSALVVNGEDYPTEDGTCVRDFVHVSDLAQGHLRALESLRSGGPSGAWNLGTGRGASVRRVIEAAARVTGREIAVDVGPRRPGDASFLVADVTAAEDVLAWRAQRLLVEDMVADEWRWMSGE